MLTFDKATHLSLLFKFTSSARLSNSIWGSDVLLLSEFINIVSNLFYNFIKLIMLLYSYLVISFARYKEYIICMISFGKFSDVLPALTCAKAIGNLWSTCLGVNILRLEWPETLAMWAKSKGSPLRFCCLLKFKLMLELAARALI